MELYALGLGFLIGLAHAFDSDHIVAVSSIATRHKNIKKAMITGSFWGIGHTLTLLVLGILLFIFRFNLPSFEFFVGFMISILGLNLVYDTIKNKKHMHVHEHDGKKHFHLHSHKKTKDHTHLHSLAVGSVHGIAGSAALMLLVLQSVETIMSAVGYILLFGIGSIVGMSVISGAISLPFLFTNDNWDKKIKYATGYFSIFFGLAMMISIL